MEDVGGVDVLEAAEDLVEEVADVVRRQLLGAQQLMKVCLHQTLTTQHCLASNSFLFCFTARLFRLQGPINKMTDKNIKMLAEASLAAFLNCLSRYYIS